MKSFLNIICRIQLTEQKSDNDEEEYLPKLTNNYQTLARLTNSTFLQNILIDGIDFLS